MSLNDSSVSCPDDGENKPRVYNLGGVTIKFPSDIKPYKSQLSLMSKAVTGARKAQNCLLESPTGSGKTMAMLCSLLAWQKTVKDEAAESNKPEILEAYAIFAETSLGKETPNQVPYAAETDEITAPPKSQNRMKFIDTWASDSPAPGSDLVATEIDTDPSQTSTTRSRSPDMFEEDLEDFKPPKKKSQIKRVSADDAIVNLGPSSPSPGNSGNVLTENPTNAEIAKKPPKIRVPKIFFATRTHKQIAQVIRELKRTPYKDAKMTVLSSRDQSCIRKLEAPYPNKNEMCRALLDKDNNNRPDQDRSNPLKLNCLFKKNLDRFSHLPSLDYMGLNTPWDIEDLVSVGREKKICPYYAARSVLTQAEIVFCPYNYLVDPFIRKSMSISLKKNVIVFDEAHNIEDSMRSAVSFVLEESNLEKAIQECKTAIIIGSSSKIFGLLINTFEILLGWMRELSANLKQEVGYSSDRSCSLIGTSYVGHMAHKGIGPAFYEQFSQTLRELFEDPQNSELEDEDNEEGVDDVKEVQINKAVHKPSQNLRNVAEGLNLVWSYLYTYETKYTNDYHVVLTESVSRSFSEERSNDSLDRGWVKRPQVTAKVQLSLNFWCLNPAVAFTAFHEAHSVIVTSGTLSPMGSFQSELGVSFPNTLSTDHVIDPSQAWVASIGFGPTGRLLNGTYKNAITLDYQDEIGSSILQICQAVPYGVLCFFPSYSMLDNVIKRWQLTGKWGDLVACKHVFQEPRRGGDFEDTMHQFDYCIKKAEIVSAKGKGFPYGEQTGALYLAVFRGKLSEGIDFKDNHARAVITVSIPYPSMSDLNVKLKKKYNDSHCLRNKQVLPGNMWYEVQAFRAINQALGRCVRHRDDWGAIIMLDNRFSPDSKATMSLSKWATKEIKHFTKWDAMYSQLHHFMKKRTQLNMPVDDETEIIEAY